MSNKTIIFLCALMAAAFMYSMHTTQEQHAKYVEISDKYQKVMDENMLYTQFYNEVRWVYDYTDALDSMQNFDKLSQIFEDIEMLKYEKSLSVQ